MKKILRQIFVCLSLLAWLCVSGLSWDLLQVVAWTKMSIANSEGRSLVLAVSKTMSDAPCSLCKVVQEGRKNSEPSPVTKEEIVKGKVKGDLVAVDDGIFKPDFLVRRSYALMRDEFADKLTFEVPVPPPRRHG